MPIKCSFTDEILGVFQVINSRGIEGMNMTRKAKLLNKDYELLDFFSMQLAQCYVNTRDKESLVAKMDEFLELQTKEEIDRKKFLGAQKNSIDNTIKINNMNEIIEDSYHKEIDNQNCLYQAAKRKFSDWFIHDSSKRMSIKITEIKETGPYSIRNISEFSQKIIQEGMFNTEAAGNEVFSFLH